MSWIHRFGLQAMLREFFGSLERRLVGTLLLIVASTIVLHFMSLDQALKLRDESAALRAAASNAEHAGQLVKSANQFRIATNIYLSPDGRSSAESASDELTDAAIQIGEQINSLRMNGMPLYEMSNDMAAFDEIDQHVAKLKRSRLTSKLPLAAQTALEQRNAAIVALANMVQAKATDLREQAESQLTSSVRKWYLFVSLIGAITTALVLLILFDVLRNIIPALRKMHSALRRLADGDLDCEIENFKLNELQALSGSLETFRRNAQAVKNLAFTDPSTGMPNRRAFVERATARLAAGCSAGEQNVVIMLADVDRFKHVNDDYGHAAGDLLVKLIGARFQQVLGDEAIIARVGGDEFAICIPLRAGESDPAIGSRLVTATSTAFDLGHYTVAVTISLGLITSDCSAGACDVEALLNKADLALYASKSSGRNQATSFDREMEEERAINRALESDLVQAFAEGQLRMVYQPILPISEGEDEVEALARWNHPTLGEISPAEFIPAAERSGLMVQLGSWVIERALSDLKRWPRLSMSINLSPLQLQQEGFVALLMDCCRKNDISPRRIFLEVTESLSIERNARALLTLELLRTMGFRIALDDFGTGYSSLCMLKTFKFDRLKLDRSLIGDLGKDNTSKAVFDAAVTMALSIGAEVVAEGVSEIGLVEPVRSAGCTHLQGFHYSHPIEADAVEIYYGSATLPVRRVA